MEPKKISEKHCDVLLDGKTRKILSLIVKMEHNGNKSLHLRTKIRGQDFLTSNLIVLIEFKGNKFACKWKGTGCSGSLYNYIYEVLDMPSE